MFHFINIRQELNIRYISVHLFIRDAGNNITALLTWNCVNAHFPVFPILDVDDLNHLQQYLQVEHRDQGREQYDTNLTSALHTAYSECEAKYQMGFKWTQSSLNVYKHTCR